MTTAPTAPVTPIKVSGPAGIAAMVPTMLGFHPTDSAVVVMMAGERRRVGPVARIDLPTNSFDADETAAALVAHAVTHADAVIIVGYQDHASIDGYGDPAPHPFLSMLAAAMVDAGVPVADSMYVVGGMIRPTAAPDDDARPVVPMPGTDDPTARQLAQAQASIGRSTLPDRAALRRSIAGPRGATLAAAVELYAATLAAPVARTTAQLDALVDRALVTPHRPAAALAAITAAITARPALRDHLASRVVSDPARIGEWVALLTEMTAAAPDAFVADTAAVLAIAAYRAGDGALAQVAIDRALTAAPSHELARLILATINTGPSPDQFARIVTG